MESSNAKAVFTGDGNAGSQVAFNYGTVNNNFGAAASASASDQNAPLFRDGCVTYSRKSLQPVRQYVARPSLTSRLEKQLAQSEQDSEESRVVVACGLGGVGKSQLVLRYVQEHRSQYSACFWLAATSQESIDADFVQLYRLLYNKATSGKDALPKQEDIVLAVRDWLAQRKGRKLLIFDGADDVCNTESEAYYDLATHLPDGPAVDAIITTRSNLVKALGTNEAIEVDAMDKHESAALFCKSAGVRISPLEPDIQAVVEELGHLALAVTLAGHYVSRYSYLRSNPKLYLQEYQEQRDLLLTQKPLKLVHQYGESILVTWETSLKALKASSPRSVRFLTLLAFLNFDDIFRELFQIARLNSSPSCSNEEQLEAEWQSFVDPDSQLRPRDIEAMLSSLEDYCFVQRTRQQAASSDAFHQDIDGSEAYQMHKLVHAWSFERLSPPDKLEAGLAASKLSSHIARATMEDLALRIRLTPHISKSVYILETISGLSKQQEVTFGSMMWEVAHFLEHMGKYRDTEVARRLQIRCFITGFGVDHKYTMIATHNLVGTVRELGKNDEALELSEELLGRRQRLLGETHAETLATKHAHAQVLSSLGRNSSALLIEQEVLRDRQKLFGRYHTETMATLNNIAGNLDDLGQYEKALEYQKEVLEYRKNSQGDDHPETLTTMSNLAMTLSHLGRFAEAATLNNVVVDERKRVFGPQHPNTLAALNNAATYLHEAGLCLKALEQHEECVRGRQELLGSRHPRTLESLNNLALELGYVGRFKDALAIQEDIVPLLIQAYGKHNWRTLSTRGNLACTLRKLGRLEEAEAIHREVLDSRSKLLPSKHPDLATSQYDLASVLGDRGLHKEALKLSEQACKSREETLGKEHPLTLNSMQNTAVCLIDLGMTKEAIALQESILAVKQRVLGRNHPSSLLAERNLALSLTRLGELDQAVLTLKRLIGEYSSAFGDSSRAVLVTKSNLAAIFQQKQDLERVAEIQVELVHTAETELGQDDKDTVLFKHNLAYTLSLQGRWAEAEDLQKRVLATRRKTLGVGHRDTIMAAQNLGTFLKEQHKLQDARVVLYEALEDGRNERGDYDAQVLQVWNSLLQVVLDQEDFELAETISHDYFGVQEKGTGHQSRELLGTKNRYAVRLLDRAEKPAQAEMVLAQICDYGRQSADVADDVLAIWVANLADSQSQQAKHGQSADSYTEALALRTRSSGESYGSIGLTLEHLSSALWMNGQFDLAEATQRRHLELLVSEFGQHHEKMLEEMNLLAVNLGEYLGKFEDAERLLEQTIAFASGVMESNSEDFIALKRNLAFALFKQGKFDRSENITQTLLKDQLSNAAPESEVRNTLSVLSDILKAQGNLQELEKVQSRVDIALVNLNPR